MANDGSMGPDGCAAYLATDDDIAKGHRGHHRRRRHRRRRADGPGDLGQMGIYVDAGGGFIGAWQAGEHEGFAERAVHGTPGWFELWTRDFHTTVDYYREVFGA